MAAVEDSGGSQFRPELLDITPLRPALQHLRESFADDVRRAPSARLFHALQIRSGIASDEPFSEWHEVLPI